MSLRLGQIVDRMRFFPAKGSCSDGHLGPPVAHGCGLSTAAAIQLWQAASGCCERSALDGDGGSMQCKVR